MVFSMVGGMTAFVLPSGAGGGLAACSPGYSSLGGRRSTTTSLRGSWGPPLPGLLLSCPAAPALCFNTADPGWHLLRKEEVGSNSREVPDNVAVAAAEWGRVRRERAGDAGGEVLLTWRGLAMPALAAEPIFGVSMLVSRVPVCCPTLPKLKLAPAAAAALAPLAAPLPGAAAAAAASPPPCPCPVLLLCGCSPRLSLNAEPGLRYSLRSDRSPPYCCALLARPPSAAYCALNCPALLRLTLALHTTLLGGRSLLGGALHTALVGRAERPPLPALLLAPLAGAAAPIAAGFSPPAVAGRMILFDFAGLDLDLEDLAGR
mmetsp:Transcript_26334/g.57459  ORF Transcript_26334/g.57459 Transcript_26334/m.57459 type:complete len:318 (+) Transcript_26334:777-1730(+)